MPRRKPSHAEPDTKTPRKRSVVVEGPDEDGDDEPGADVDFDDDVVNPLLVKPEPKKPRGRK